MHIYTLLLSSALVVADFLAVFTAKLPAADSAKDTASLAAVSAASVSCHTLYTHISMCIYAVVGVSFWVWAGDCCVSRRVACLPAGVLAVCWLVIPVRAMRLYMNVCARLYLDPIKVNKHACTQWILWRLQPHSNFQLERLL